MPMPRECVRVGAVSGTGPAHRSGTATRTTGGRGTATRTTDRGVRTHAGATADGVALTRPAGSATPTGATDAGSTGDGPT